MGLGKFVRENLVLLAGIALPVVMMAGFLVASSLPQTVANPPQYDLVFFTDDYNSNSNGNLRTTVNLVVKNGTLVAQYVPAGENNYGYWKKIYRYEAATQTVREIPFGFPPDFTTLTAMREEPVAGLEGVTLDTRLQAPDGYELSGSEYRGNGLIGDLFWRSGTDSPRLRNGSSSVPLELASDTQYYTYGNLQFLGWVVQ